MHHCFNLVCIYGDPHHLQTRAIWDDVVAFVLANPSMPSFCMGDMNDIMNANVKRGPHSANASRIWNFYAYVKSCGFIDLAFNDPAFG